MNNKNAETCVIPTGNGKEAVQITFVPGTGITATLGTLDAIGTRREQFIPTRPADEMLFTDYPDYEMMFFPGLGWNVELTQEFVDGVKKVK